MERAKERIDMKNVGALFDVDGTLYRDSLMVEHFKKMIKYEIIDPSIWHNEAKHTFHNWDKRQGNYEDYLLEVAQIYINSIKGINRKHMEFMCDQVIAQKGERVYVYTRDRIRWHKEKGHTIIFISGGPDYLVEKMAEKYGVQDFVGTKYHVDNQGILTGEIDQMWDSHSKEDAIKNFEKKYGLDLEKSYAYGDTNGDISMLRAVGNPTAINPVRELLVNIKKDKVLKEKVRLIVERKDVIYELSTDVEILD